jgi:hypothetical protein
MRPDGTPDDLEEQWNRKMFGENYQPLAVDEETWERDHDYRPWWRRLLALVRGD